MKYYFCQLGGVIYAEDELRQILIRMSSDLHISVNKYISNENNKDMFIPIQQGDYVLMSNCPYYNSMHIKCHDLAQNQIVDKYSQLYPTGTKITMYDYQMNKIEWVV